MIILALDALDYDMVQKHQCTNLMQKEGGQTDITVFDEARTVVLWASFLTGKNLEAQIPVKTQWEFKLSEAETFLQYYDTYKAIDVPAFSFKDQNHRDERRLLKAYFDDATVINEYDAAAWKTHEENKHEFLDAIGQFELVMGYFNLADAVGHLSFGIAEKMRRIYAELEELAKAVRISDDFILVISDHGMRAVGRYGDHTKHGFYSVNRKLGLTLPAITDFYDLMRPAVR